MIILVKNKVWVNGPIYIHDVPWQRLMPDDLDGIQRFLCEILTTPMKQEGGNMPATVPVKEFLRLLQAKSLRQAVEAYKCLQVRVENNALIATIYNRELSTKSWSTTETVVREPKWQQEKLGAQALLAAFALAE